MTELFKNFQEFRKILCVCPCCGDIVRISDLKLKIKRYSGITWLDNYDKEQVKLEQLEQQFKDEKKKLQEIARNKGSERADEIFNNAISPSLKKLHFNPHDLKPIFYPIDFVVFKGLREKKSVDDVILLSKFCDSPVLQSIREKIEVAVLKEQYDWQEARIGERGEISFK